MCSGAPAPTAPGAGLLSGSKGRVAGQEGAGRAHSRCQQVKKASFQGQVRLIFSIVQRSQPGLRTRLPGHRGCLERYSPAELISFARRLDPDLEGQDFAEAGQQLDQMPDYASTSFGLSQQDVARLREQFSAWPRRARGRRRGHD